MDEDGWLLQLQNRKPVRSSVYSRLSRPPRFGKVASERRGQLFHRVETVTCSVHSFSLIACTRPSGPHVRNNGQRVGVCPKPVGLTDHCQGVRATQVSAIIPSAACYPRLLISYSRCVVCVVPLSRHRQRPLNRNNFRLCRLCRESSENRFLYELLSFTSRLSRWTEKLE